MEIKYKLHLPDGTQREERIPLVIGVIANLSGDVTDDREPLIDSSRDFRHIHKDNFDKVLEKAKPRLEYTVPDVLKGKGNLHIALEFKSLKDFHPDQLVAKIAPLREQQATRKRLQDLLNLLGADPKLEAKLQDYIDDPIKRKAFLDDVNRREQRGVDR